MGPGTRASARGKDGAGRARGPGEEAEAYPVLALQGEGAEPPSSLCGEVGGTTSMGAWKQNVESQKTKQVTARTPLKS